MADPDAIRYNNNPKKYEAEEKRQKELQRALDKQTRDEEDWFGAAHAAVPPTQTPASSGNTSNQNTSGGPSYNSNAYNPPNASGVQSNNSNNKNKTNTNPMENFFSTNNSNTNNSSTSNKVKTNTNPMQYYLNSDNSGVSTQYDILNGFHVLAWFYNGMADEVTRNVAHIQMPNREEQGLVSDLNQDAQEAYKNGQIVGDIYSFFVGLGEGLLVELQLLLGVH